MKKERLYALGLTAALMLGTTACSTDKTLVPVQQVGMLTGAMEASDKYPGVVVSENVAEVQRDGEKAIKELYVSEGDQVTAGQKLFSYDVEQLNLELDQKQLELERISNDISTCKSRISTLEAQLKKAKDTAEKTSLNLQISTETANKNEAEYNKKVKQKEIDQVKSMLGNVDVTSPVNGRIRKINENGSEMGGTGGSNAYITIQEAGSYRIKGTLNELSMSGGIAEGVAVNVISRMDHTVIWTGTVSNIDYEGGTQNSNNNGGVYYMGGGMMDGGSDTTTTSYPFYVELDDSEGLLLGQHVYIEVAGNGGKAGLWVPESYLMDIQEDPETLDTTASIWVANEKNKLEKRELILGSHDEETGTYEVKEGLGLTDYVADPSTQNCTEGAFVSYRNVTDFTPDPSDSMEETIGGDDPMDDGFVEDGTMDDGMMQDGLVDDFGVDGFVDGEISAPVEPEMTDRME